MMIGVAWLFAAGLLLAVNPLSAQSDYRWEVRSRCIPVTNSYECSRALEKAEITLHPERVRRDGDWLRLRLHSGDWLALRDVEAALGADVGRVRMYSLDHFYPEVGYYVVFEGHYEGDRFLLIDARTGQRQEVVARPMLSPDRRYFAALSYDLEAGYSPNRIEIWQIGSEGLELSYWLDLGEGATWGPGDPLWTDARTLEFTQHFHHPDGRRGEDPARLLLDNDGSWYLDHAWIEALD